MTVAGYPVYDLDIRHTLTFPILGSQPVTIETLFDIGCITSGIDRLKCSSGLGLQLYSLSVIDSNGDPVTGFRYSASSNYGYELEGGTLDQSLPEPSTFLLTAAALAVSQPACDGRIGLSSGFCPSITRTVG